LLLLFCFVFWGLFGFWFFFFLRTPCITQAGLALSPPASVSRQCWDYSLCTTSSGLQGCFSIHTLQSTKVVATKGILLLVPCCEVISL
jgi:hypothetical protein